MQNSKLVYGWGCRCFLSLLKNSLADRCPSTIDNEVFFWKKVCAKICLRLRVSVFFVAPEKNACGQVPIYHWYWSVSLKKRVRQNLPAAEGIGVCCRFWKIRLPSGAHLLLIKNFFFEKTCASKLAYGRLIGVVCRSLKICLRAGAHLPLIMFFSQKNVFA